jgi:glycosyltransferase involved in cell wall biosynthesis
MSQISIVIPVYNAQKTLEPCLQSIFNQTFKDIEIIAVNDGSTDASLEILNKYQDKIKIISQDNQGAPAARNQGAAAAGAPYLIFCDADIVMQPEMLEKLYQALQDNPAASFAYSDFKFGFKTFKLFPFDSTKLKQTPYIHTTSLIRQDHFPGFDSSLKRFQDWDLWLTMSELGHIGQYVPKILFKIVARGTMSRWRPKIFQILPWLPSIKAYQQAELIIKNKHRL